MIYRPGAVNSAQPDAVCVNCRTRCPLSTKLTIRGILSLARPFGPGEQLPLSSHHGRNARCPCGSGEKYKRCCLAVGEAYEIPSAHRRLVKERLDAAVAVDFGADPSSGAAGGTLYCVTFDLSEFELDT